MRSVVGDDEKGDVSILLSGSLLGGVLAAVEGVRYATALLSLFAMEGGEHYASPH